MCKELDVRGPEQQPSYKLVSERSLVTLILLKLFYYSNCAEVRCWLAKSQYASLVAARRKAAIKIQSGKPQSLW